LASSSLHSTGVLANAADSSLVDPLHAIVYNDTERAQTRSRDDHQLALSDARSEGKAGLVQ
jgi:hypothetical protein